MSNVWKKGVPGQDGLYLVCFNGKVRLGTFVGNHKFSSMSHWIVEGTSREKVDGWLEVPEPIAEKIPFAVGDFFRHNVPPNAIQENCVFYVINESQCKQLNRDRDSWVRVAVKDCDLKEGR